MKRYSAIIVTIFGVANFLFAVAGGWYLGETVRNYFRATTRASNSIVETHGFTVTFFIMTSINLIFLCLLICAGVLLLRFRLSGITFCIVVFAAEICYLLHPFFIGGTSWFKDVGAEGMGNVGLVPQILTGYPVVGLIILFLVRRNLRRDPEARSIGAVPNSI